MKTEESVLTCTKCNSTLMTCQMRGINNNCEILFCKHCSDNLLKCDACEKKFETFFRKLAGGKSSED